MIIFILCTLQDSFITFNYAYSSRSDEPIHYRVYWSEAAFACRRSSSEPPTSLDSFSGFADDEFHETEDELETNDRFIADPAAPSFSRHLCIIVIFIVLFGSAFLLFFIFQVPVLSFLSHSLSLRSKN